MKNLHFALLIIARVVTVFLCFAFLNHEWRTLFHHGSVHILATTVATLLAALLVWVPDRNVRGWNWVAFVVLVIGMLLVALTFTAWSFAAIAVIAAASLRLRRLHQRRTPAGIVVEGTRVIIPLEMKITPQCAPVVAREKRSQKARPTPAATEKDLPVAREVPATPIPAAQPAPMQEPRAVPAQQTSTAIWDFSENVRRPRHDFSAVVGMQDTKSRLFRAAQEILEGTSKNHSNGILLFGDPGNGKTFFAEALSGQLRIPFISISYGDVASKWVNETPSKVKAVFAEARRIGNCLLFIDEIDSFVKPRDGNVHSLDRDLTNVMLTEIVGLRGSKVILVAATNFLADLDGAGRREGRFDSPRYTHLGLRSFMAKSS